MQHIPEAEARALLAEPLICEDCPDWEHEKTQPHSLSTETGLVDADGIRTGLHVKLIFSRSPSTGIVRHIFTVYKRNPWGLTRVYQLEVSKWKKHQPKDKHQLSHEHIGRSRTEGDASWSHWTYDEIIVHFCRQTNITFKPPLSHPEDFRLRG
ncbi:hypothetical protein [Caldimonas tepidiphila]|uniref:hypothetical protein n=1 Tax=Caldimonas tepidiphila TaxID=2315841 RepID=UPI000E5B0466|nr:hypothetical protein [Caldimonas tepidiphila]